MSIDSSNPKAPTKTARESMEIRSSVSPWLRALLKPIHPIFIHLYFQVKIHHGERIPQDGPVILAPTHRSRWDTLFLHLLTKRFPRFLTSMDEFIGLQSWFIRRLGAFPVNTRRPTAGSMRHCRDLLLAGEPLGIFPEGTIYYYPPDNVHPIKPGVAWLALDCQRRLPDVSLKIVPIRLNYGHRKLRFRSKVDVEVQEPILVRLYLDRPKDQAIADLTADMQAALGDIVNTSELERSPDRTPTPENSTPELPSPASANPDHLTS